MKLGRLCSAKSHDTETNDFGIYMLLIGEGNGSDDLRTIDWSDSDYYIETVIRIDGGEELVSVSRLNSVPYALTSFRSVMDEVEDADSDPGNEIQELVLNGNELSLTNGNSVDLSALSSQETITALIDNGDGTYSYFSEDGRLTIISTLDTQTAIGLSSDNQSIEYIDEFGITTVLNLCAAVDSCETITKLRWNQNTNSLEYINEEGAMDVIELTDIPVSGEYVESLTSLTYNSVTDQLIYVDEEGVNNVINIPVSGELADETTTTISLNHNFTSLDYVDEDGVTTNLDLCNVVDNCETVTSLIWNSTTNSLEFTNEDGATNAIGFSDIPISGEYEETLTNLTYNSITNQLVYVDEAGVNNVINLPATGEVVDETVTEISLGSNNQFISYIDEKGVTTDLNLCAAVDSCETVTSLTLSTSGELVYLDEEGSVNVIDINNIKEEDPEDASKMISYAPLSGSEQAIFERGTMELKNGEAVIEFSNHFKKLMALNTMTVSLTPHSADTYGLAVIKKTANGIVVKELMKGQSNFSFDWEVKATRKSGLTHQVIQNK